MCLKENRGKNILQLFLCLSFFRKEKFLKSLQMNRWQTLNLRALVCGACILQKYSTVICRNAVVVAFLNHCCLSLAIFCITCSVVEGQLLVTSRQRQVKCLGIPGLTLVYQWGWHKHSLHPLYGPCHGELGLVMVSCLCNMHVCTDMDYNKPVRVFMWLGTVSIG